MYVRERKGWEREGVGRSVGRKACVAKLNVVERTKRGEEGCFERTYRWAPVLLIVPYALS